MVRNRFVRFARSLSLLLLLVGPFTASAQTEKLFQTIGADTRREFAHTGLPGATGIEFRFSGAFAPPYPVEESHIVVITFEWRASAADPWSSSPDNVKSIRGGETRFFDTGVFLGPTDAALVAVHFFAGSLMTVSGDFAHVSVVPEPGQFALYAGGLALLGLWRVRPKIFPLC